MTILAALEVPVIKKLKKYGVPGMRHIGGPGADAHRVNERHGVPKGSGRRGLSLKGSR